VLDQRSGQGGVARDLAREREFEHAQPGTAVRFGDDQSREAHLRKSTPDR